MTSKSQSVLLNVQVYSSHHDQLNHTLSWPNTHLGAIFLIREIKKVLINSLSVAYDAMN